MISNNKLKQLIDWCITPPQKQAILKEQLVKRVVNIQNDSLSTNQLLTQKLIQMTKNNDVEKSLFLIDVLSKKTKKTENFLVYYLQEELFNEREN